MRISSWLQRYRRRKRSTARSLASGGRRTLVLLAASPSDDGGAGRRSALYAEGFAAAGWRVIMIGRRSSGKQLTVRRSEEGLIIDVPGFGRPSLGALAFTVVAVPTGMYYGARGASFLAVQLASQSLVAATCGLLLRRPAVGTASSLGEVDYLKGSWLRRTILKGLTAVVAQTDDAARALGTVLERYPIVVPNPVAASERNMPLQGRPTVLFAGRLAAEKRLDTLLMAWEAFAAERTDASLIIAGRGGEFRSVEPELRETIAASPLLTATVQLPGWVDVRTVLPTCDLFVLPSETEGMSNALLEAAAAGRIIIASNIPQNVAVLGANYPFLFPVGDSSALAAALEHAMADRVARGAALRVVRERMARHDPAVVVRALEVLLSARKERGRDRFGHERDLERAQ